MGRPSNSAERRAQIVAGLRRVMAGRGYAGASVAEIARAAGLSAGLVHYHFGAKREILAELVVEIGRGLRQRFERLATDRSTPRGRLEAWIDAHLALGEGADAETVACWVWVGAEAVVDPWVREAYSQELAADVALGTELLEALGVDEAREGALSLVAAFEGAYRMAAGTEGLVEPGWAAPAVRALVDGMVG